MEKQKAFSESEICQCSTTRIAFGEKFEGHFSVKIIQNLKKSVIVKFPFNESCITVGNRFYSLVGQVRVLGNIRHSEHHIF